MPLFQVEIMDQERVGILQWKERPSAKSALEWAENQALEIFGEASLATCRYRIEEEKPVA